MTGIFSTANNGLITPAGLTVGMDADAIEQAYGEPWKNDRGYISYHEEGKWLVFTTPALYNFYAASEVDEASLHKA